MDRGGREESCLETGKEVMDDTPVEFLLSSVVAWKSVAAMLLMTCCRASSIGYVD